MCPEARACSNLGLCFCFCSVGHWIKNQASSQLRSSVEGGGSSRPVSPFGPGACRTLKTNFASRKPRATKHVWEQFDFEVEGLKNQTDKIESNCNKMQQIYT